MKHFTMRELTRSTTAAKHNIINEPTAECRRSLVSLVDNVLDPAREEYGKPINVTSGYRNRCVNRLVGGSDNSQHVSGCAADIVCDNNKELFDIIRKQGNFDKLIAEKITNDGNMEWIHVSYRKGNCRHLVMGTKDCKTYFEL